MPQLIGTRSESSLHRDLKFTYAGLGGQTEVEVAGYVADGVNAAGEYIEVQTGNFGALKKKAHELARLGKVRVIYPVIITKYIEVFNIQGKRQYRRKSPKRGNLWNIFDALIHAPELPLIRGLSIELVVVDASEHRVQDGKGARRRRGVSIKDRTLLTVYERVLLKKPSDYFRFVPFTPAELFTSAQLGERAGIGTDRARKTLYVLSKMGLVHRTGKQGNALVYRIVTPQKSVKRTK